MKHNHKNPIISFFKIQYIFPSVVLLFSLLNILRYSDNVFIFSCLFSLIGIAGVICFAKKINAYKTLFYIWILVQIVIIDVENVNSNSGIVQTTAFWNMAQFLSLKAGFYIQTKFNTIVVNLNFIPLIYIAFLRLLQFSSLKGKQVFFSKFKENNRLGEIFPLKGVILKRVTLSKDKEWLLVELANSFTYWDKSIEYVLIQPKDGTLLKLKTKQIVYFRLVDDITKISEIDNNINDFPFVDWVICE